MKMTGELVIITGFTILLIIMADPSMIAKRTADDDCIICNETDCLNNFVKIGDYCYYFNNKPGTWMNGFESCKRKSAKLAHPMNSYENYLLISHLKAQFNKTEGWWIGGTNIKEQTKWLWSHNQKPVEFTYWVKNEEPDNVTYERCLLYYRPDKYGWHNVNCNDKYSYICQQ